MNSSAQKKITLVPLERELRDSHKKREVVDQLTAMGGQVGRILGAGLDGEKFSAYDALRKAIAVALGVVKNFRA
jgi:hypothetical protein